MTLEDFKDVYKDKTPVEKLKLMQVQHAYWRDDMKDRVDANWRGNFEEAQYYARECDAMRDRVVWLHDEISKALERDTPKLVKRWNTKERSPYCPSDDCGRPLEEGQHYCGFCGQAVKWE